MQSDPQLWSLFQRASNFKKGQYSTEEFQARLMETDWWKNNSESARRGLAAKAIGGADWEAMLQEGRNVIQQEASTMGQTVDKALLDTLAEDYVMGGWDQADRRQTMRNAILNKGQTGGQGDSLAGQAGDLQQQIMEIAAANGMKISREYAESAARSVQMGLSTEEDWLRTTRQQAASMWGPGWSDKIMAGVDARELATGYVNLMAQEFGILPDQIDLNDPYIRKAMTGVDANGNAAPQSLFDFQQQLRHDPRWMRTKQAEDKISDIGVQVLKQFGFMG